jgi:hypothetical protein
MPGCRRSYPAAMMVMPLSNLIVTHWTGRHIPGTARPAARLCRAARRRTGIHPHNTLCSAWSIPGFVHTWFSVMQLLQVAAVVVSLPGLSLLLPGIAA